MEPISKLTQTQYEIIAEIAKAAEKLGANSGLIANIMSWGDTLPDNEILDNLRDWNNRRFAKTSRTLQHQ